MKRLSFFAIAILMLTACEHKEVMPKDILSKAKMQDVMWSMINAGEFLNGYVLIKDSIDKNAASAKVYGQVLQFHHITKQEFDKSYAWYRDHPDVMKSILDSLLKKQTISPGVSKRPDTLQRKRLIEEGVK